MTTDYARPAGRYHSWCADCGSKNHQNANECNSCGAGSDGSEWQVKYKTSVGNPEYTTDGERGVYERGESDGE